MSAGERPSVRIGSLRVTRTEASAIVVLVRARDAAERARGSLDVGTAAWFRSTVRRLATEAGVMTPEGEIAPEHKLNGKAKRRRPGK